jgi:tetratricopeptide (TPR) repeat protein
VLLAVRFGVLGVFALPIVTAQKPAAPGTPSGNGSSAVMIVPSQSGANPWPGSQLPVMLSGTVVIEGAGGPAANVAIQRFCGNIPRTAAWTNGKGQFSFQWNNFSGVVTEASDPGLRNAEPQSTSGPNNAPSLPNGPSSSLGATSRTTTDELPGMNMRGCQLEANAAGFHSDRVDLSEHRALDNPDIGVIVLHRISRAPEISVSATALSAPKGARKAWERGVQLLRPEQWDPAGAEREFEKAVRIYPKFAEAWLYLGRALVRERAEDRAREAFLKAIDADDKLPEPFMELGMMASRHLQWPGAARYLDRALQLDPVDYPHLWYDDAEADYHSGNLDRAEKNVREAVKMAAPNREPGATRLLGLVLMSKHDYAGAEAALEAYLREFPDIEDWLEMKAKLAEIRGYLTAPR